MKNVTEEDMPIFDKYFEIDERYSEELTSDIDPHVQDNMGGVKIQTFVPKSCSRANINNHSIVTVVSYAQSKVVIPGDNEPSWWKELLEQTEFVEAVKNSDLLLASHHGRDSGFYNGLFSQSSPWLTIISDGRFCDTSATGRYDNVTKGWKVYYRSGGSEKRKCLTTRNHGFVLVKLGYNERTPYINVAAKGK